MNNNSKIVDRIDQIVENMSEKEFYETHKNKVVCFNSKETMDMFVKMLHRYEYIFKLIADDDIRRLNLWGKNKCFVLSNKKKEFDIDLVSVIFANFKEAIYYHIRDEEVDYEYINKYIKVRSDHPFLKKYSDEWSNDKIVVRSIN